MIHINALCIQPAISNIKHVCIYVCMYMHAYQFRRRAMRGDASASIEIDLNGPEWLAILQQRAHNKYS